VFDYGLLKEETKDTYKFLHLTFQEFLCALYLKDLLENDTERDKAC
jgi:predicted NACHT family NTPase